MEELPLVAESSNLDAAGLSLIILIFFAYLTIFSRGRGSLALSIGSRMSGESNPLYDSKLTVASRARRGPAETQHLLGDVDTPSEEHPDCPNPLSMTGKNEVRACSSLCGYVHNTGTSWDAPWPCQAASSMCIACGGVVA